MSRWSVSVHAGLAAPAAQDAGSAFEYLNRLRARTHQIELQPCTAVVSAALFEGPRTPLAPRGYPIRQSDDARPLRQEHLPTVAQHSSVGTEEHFEFWNSGARRVLDASNKASHCLMEEVRRHLQGLSIREIANVDWQLVL
jgi:hypothetical protein